MIENLNKLQIALLHLHLRKQDYIKEIKKDNVSAFEKRLLAANEQMLNNIDNLISIVSAKVQHETSTGPHFYKIISLVSNY
ncbi:MAG: hypothetical protein WC756_11480 [Taibaiella sp.]|jgi:transcriptional regulator